MIIVFGNAFLAWLSLPSLHRFSIFFFLKLSVCQVLNLSVNDLSGPLPSDLANLKRLTHLWLFANRLTGPAFPEVGHEGGGVS